MINKAPFFITLSTLAACNVLNTSSWGYLPRKKSNEFKIIFSEFVVFILFDIIAKKRDDPYEHGEIKRVVNNFMQMLDNYNGNSLIIAATNHQHLLDTAIWRRFDDILYFDMPDDKRREQLFNKYLKRYNQ